MIDYAKYIKNALSLRDPQKDALYIFQNICDTISLQKDPTKREEIELEFKDEISGIEKEEKRNDFIKDKMSEYAKEYYQDDFDKVTSIYPTLTSFERDFPSFTFALATGIGKTRLMGAMIAYLHYAKGINNFFVMAPNLTIYNKLKEDLGTPSHSKYVFKGLDKFVTAPKIIDGDSYETFGQQNVLTSNITINIFNIAKLTNDSKTTKGKPARMKRLNEVLGSSYFDYLKNLEDLCIFMDESHHYHADKSFEVINELKPILGVEVTATPQVQKGSKAIPFKNVVYEYSLAHALNDEKYVKVPVVVTRKDFKPDQYTPEDLDKEKLNDGIKLHIDTQANLDLYARSHSKKAVKPFVLVVAKDTEHSKQIREYLTSNDFYRGKYKNKVLEINSSQKGSEKDENIAQLLKLEKPDNEIEIVIHVNMLKEGWDVTNLYTIIPLRASASETLTEQTIGRGLRLPYGERTNVEEVDRLAIVSHDKYADIIKLANDENSLVRKIYYIDPTDNPLGESKETIELKSTYDDEIDNTGYTEQLALLLPQLDTDKPEETKKDIAKFIAKYAGATVQEMNKRATNINDVKTPEYQEIIIKSVVAETKRVYKYIDIRTEDIIECVTKATEFSTQTLTQKVIPILVGTVQAVSDIKVRYEKFKLDVTGINFVPSDDTLIGTELKEDGRTFDIDVAYAGINPTDTPQNAIVKFIIAKDNIDYSKASEVIYDVMDQLEKHLYSYLHTEEFVNRVLKERRKNLAENLYSQINKNFYKEGTAYTVSEMRPFSKIEIGFADKFESDKIYKYTDNVIPSEIKKKIFAGFKKSCHGMYKFDSSTEKTFATVLENDTKVLKWMCPSIKQFNLYYDKSSSAKYQPDFIVETESKIYMIETKDSRMLEDKIVLAKAKTGTEYCKAASSYNLANGGKEWEYKLVSHEEVSLNSSFDAIINNSNHQMSFD